MKYLKNIFLLLAGCLLLLHSFIPHQHHSELSEEEHIEQHEEADDLFEFLQLVFHIDFGEDHLEKFKTSSFHFDLADLPDTQQILYTPYLILEREFLPFQNTSFSSIEEKYIQKFRGPPSLS